MKCCRRALPFYSRGIDDIGCDGAVQVEVRVRGSGAVVASRGVAAMIACWPAPASLSQDGSVPFQVKSSEGFARAGSSRCNTISGNTCMTRAKHRLVVGWLTEHRWLACDSYNTRRTKKDTFS